MMSQELDCPPGWSGWFFRDYAAIFGWSVLLTVVMHWPMLAQLHREGDETVYFALAEQMHWDLSHYTTRDDSRVNSFPASIYTGPLFHQPPLYPLLLKVGLAWNSNPLLARPEFAASARQSSQEPGLVPPGAVAMAFLVSVGLTTAAFWTTWRLMALWQIEPCWGWLAFAGLLVCPLVAVSTLRVHHDGLLGLALLCGLGAYTEALTRRSYLLGAWAACWLVIAFNLRFNAIVAAPLIVLFPCVEAWRSCQNAGLGPQAFWSQLNWRLLLLVAVPVLVLGGQHYFRLLATYGTLSPGSLLQPVHSPQFADWERLIASATRVGMLTQIVVTVPLLAMLAFPSSLKACGQGLARGAWPAWWMASFLFLMTTQTVFSFFLLRYFAAAMPLIHVCWPTLLRAACQSERWRTPVLGFTGSSLMLMLLGYTLNGLVLETNAFPFLPGLIMLWPTLIDWFRVT